MNETPVRKLQKECQQSLSGLSKQAYLYRRRRIRLIERLLYDYQPLLAALLRFPVLSPDIQEAYGEFKYSYDLFCVQFEGALASLESKTWIQSKPGKPKSHDIQQWQDYCDDLKDDLKDQARTIEQYEKNGFLEVLRILDTAERIQEFNFPEIDVYGKRYRKALIKVQNHMVQLSTSILLALHQRSINEIQLFPGTYPPIETTRILYREDNQTNDEILISRVTEKGYTWKKAILRKAAVVVITKSKE